MDITKLPVLQTVVVPHLGGTTAAYRALPATPNPAKDTLVLVNSFQTSSALYYSQFGDQALTDRFNLVAIEPLGHGGSKCPTEHFTFWDSAIMNLQALETLGVKTFYALGTSQGGWIVVRQALLAPKAVKGLIVCGTSMDAESEGSKALGCWDPNVHILPSLALYEKEDPAFVFPEQFVEMGFSVGFGQDYSFAPDEKEEWIKLARQTYSGVEGQRKARQAAINLLDRDSLLLRIGDIRCPVLWLHGTADPVYSVAEAKKDLGLFTRSERTELVVLDGGAHYLSLSRPKEVNEETLRFFGGSAE